MDDELERWARQRAPELLSRAEEEAVAALRGVLLEAALRRSPRPEPKEARPPQRDPVEGDGLWVYCVVSAGDGVPEGTAGVSGSGTSRVKSGDLAALVSRVPLAEFGAEPLRRNLNDIAWLEGVARAHEEVLEAALATSNLVPLRLCTIYENEEGVQRMLEDERESLVEALELLDGRQEWGLKLLVDPEKLSQAARSRSDEAGALDDERSAGTGGGAYMFRRRFERRVRDMADALATEVAEDVHARLEDWAIGAVTRPAQNRDLSQHEGDMLLNAAYLVAVDRVEGMHELVAELEERHRPLGARLQLTGPWPPYNFVPRGGAASLA